MKQNLYRNFYYHVENGLPVFCYRSGLTLYEEVFESARLLSGGFNSAGYTQNLLGSSSQRVPRKGFVDASAFGVEVNGTSVQYDLEYKGYDVTEETEENGTPFTHVVVTLKCTVVPVIVKVHTKLDGTDVLVRYLELVNDGAESLTVGNITPFSGVLEHVIGWDQYSSTRDNAKIYSLGYMDTGAWGTEGLFSWHDLHANGTSVAGKFGTARWRHPMFMLRNNLLGGMWIGQLGFSGGYEFKFNLQAEANVAGMETTVQNATLGCEIRLASPNPQAVLGTGESMLSPEFHFAKLFGGLDDAVNVMHAHLRKSVFTLPIPRGQQDLIASGMGPEHAMTVEGTKFFIDTAAAVGAEVFIIDAGWYCPPGKQSAEWNQRSGDWNPDPDRYPNGIAEIVDYTHDKGLLFGIWIDPERLGTLSKAAQEHPEWLQPSYNQNNHGSIIDLSNPEAAAWVEEEVARVLTETNADLFRLDYNIGTDETFVKVTKDGKRYCNTYDYYQAVYKMYRNLRKRFPHVYFENCAGGGGRTDIGMMRNFTHTWVSDWQIAPRSFAITNGMTMALPPEYVDRLASGMCCHTKGSLDFQIRQTLFGKPTTNSYNSIDSEMNPIQIDFARHCYDIYKNFIRPYLPEAKIYHHTPEITGVNPQGTGILERASAAGDRSVIGVFRLADSANDGTPTRVIPRGIVASGMYRVTFDNAAYGNDAYTPMEVSGYTLCTEGLHVVLQSSLTSELILIEKVN